MLNEQPISIRTLADYHIEEFIRCPNTFYHVHHKGVGKEQVHNGWKNQLQVVANRVIQTYFKLPIVSRTPLNLLQMIDQHWHLSPIMFDSKTHYYSVLAKFTDHLLQYLSPTEVKQPLLFLFEKLTTRIDELQINLSLTIQYGQWSNDSYVLKKFLIEEDEQLIESYKHFALLFCSRAFGSLPERIEVISLLSGKANLYFPEEQDIQQSLEYLKLLTSLLVNPRNYL